MILLSFIFFTLYNCSGNTCFGQLISTPMPVSYRDEEVEAFLNGQLIRHEFSPASLDKSHTFDFEGSDVIVYLHVQKTGGSAFGRRLVNDLKVYPPCLCTTARKMCNCITHNNKVWLFSRHSVGWKCGLHADWTELNDCVDPWFETQHDDRKRR